MIHSQNLYNNVIFFNFNIIWFDLFFPNLERKLEEGILIVVLIETMMQKLREGLHDYFETDVRALNFKKDGSLEHNNLRVFAFNKLL